MPEATGGLQVELHSYSIILKNNLLFINFLVNLFYSRFMFPYD